MTDIIEVSGSAGRERIRNPINNYLITYYYPGFIWYSEKMTIFKYCSGKIEEERGGSHRTTDVTAGASVKQAHPTFVDSGQQVGCPLPGPFQRLTGPPAPA